MEEHVFNCPYCWEEISTVVETSKIKQHYLEDCEVCFNPIELVIDCISSKVDFVHINPIAQ